MYTFDIMGVSRILLLCGLAVLAIYNNRTQMLPDKFSMFILVAGLTLRLTQVFLIQSSAPLIQGVASTALVFIVLFSVALASPKGLGGGNIKLMSAVAMFMDLRIIAYMAVAIVLIRISLAAVIILRIVKVDISSRVPSGFLWLSVTGLALLLANHIPV